MWSDDVSDPLVIYTDPKEAMAVADLGDANVVIRRVIVTTEEWGFTDVQSA